MSDDGTRPHIEADPELDAKLLEVAVQFFASGMATAFLNNGIPDAAVRPFVTSYIEHLHEDPIARLVVVEDARLIWEGRNDERRPTHLCTPADLCRHDDGSEGAGS